MVLCTISDIVDRIGERVAIQLTDDSTPPTAINNARCGQAISMASEVVLSRLAGRYSDVERLTPTPLLTMITVDIAVYMLYSRRNQGIVENVRQRYTDAIEHLEKIKLNESTPPQLNVRAQEYLSSKRGSDRVFTPQLWEHY